MISQELDGAAVLLSAAGDEMLTLNPVGTLVWRVLDRPRTVPEIVTEVRPMLAGAADVDLDGDVTAFVHDLETRDLVERVPAG